MATLLPNHEVSREILRGYRIFLFSHDHPHPAHVHFGKGKRFSSWDLATARCVDDDGLSASELRDQRTILTEQRDAIWRSWNEHWRNQNR